MRKAIGLLITCIFVFNIVASINIVSALGPPALEKRLFIHYRQGFGKPPGTPGNGPPSPSPDDGSDTGYYDFLGKGVKWKATASIVIDPTGSGLDSAFVVATLRESAEEWDDGAFSGWGGVTPNLFEVVSSTVSDATFDTDSPDERNEILWGDYAEDGVIAVTIIWGYFSGPPSRREIIEFDILFDTDFTWGEANTGNTVMDLQNIATHELGHAAGLADLYQNDANQETMYGYATYGETIKRDLYLGDQAGILELYG